VISVFGKFQSFGFIQSSHFLMCYKGYISFSDNVYIGKFSGLSAKALDPQREILLPKSPPAALCAAVRFFFSCLCRASSRG
jgi:hypothetical protein